MMAELWFIRHFRTPWNSEGRLQGQRDIALNDPLGRGDQAALAENRRALAGRDFALVLTSPLRRARATAMLHGFPDAIPDPDLAEIAFGEWEGRTWNDLEAAYPSAYRNALHTLPLGESLDDFTARIIRVRDRVRLAPGPVLSFGHGAWLGWFKRVLKNDTNGGMRDPAVANGALVKLNL